MQAIHSPTGYVDFCIFRIDFKPALIHLLFMTAAQTQPSSKGYDGRWFFCQIVKESAELAISKHGTAAARRLADGRYEVHTAGKKSTVSSQDAALHLKSERSIQGDIIWLNATERADVEMGRVWVGSN